MEITLLYQRPAHPIPFAAGLERYQPLANELGRYAGTTVRVAEELVPEIVDHGYLLWVTSGDPARLLGDLTTSAASLLASRTVLVDVSWQQALEQLERYGFAAAIDSLRLSQWLAHPSSALGPFGSSRLVPLIGATCVKMPALRSRHYCLLEGAHSGGMPHLLADYLRAYDEDLKAVSAVPAVMLEGPAE